MKGLTTVYDSTRTQDLLVFSNASGAGEILVSLGLGTAGKICTGIQKLAQIYVIALLSDRDTTQDPPYGTYLMNAVRKGYIRDEATLQSYVAIALKDVQEFVVKTTPDDAPEDEQFQSAELLAWDLSATTITLRIKLTSVAGDTWDYVIPATVPLS